MRPPSLRRTLGLVVSLAGFGPGLAVGCGSGSTDSSGSSQGGSSSTGQGSGSSSSKYGDAGSDSADSGSDSGSACGALSFQCSGPCVCNPAWVIDRTFTVQVSLSAACDLMKQAWPNGGNVPSGSACEGPCADTTARQCAVADAYYTAFQAANSSAGTDAAAYVCPTSAASSTVALTCDVEHLDPMGACSWTQCTTGRRPEGLCPVSASAAGRPLATYFADCARLEAASIVAFERMRGELRALGAPRALLRSAREAARDETRHARVTRALAKRFGGRTVRPAFERSRPRATVDIAIENATEGVVREMFGATIATWQARHAQDAGVRSAFERIAVDECRHAKLSWRVARWLDGRLTAAERARVRREVHRTIAALREEVDRAPDPALSSEAGLPGAPQARALLAGLERLVWGPEDRMIASSATT